MTTDIMYLVRSMYAWLNMEARRQAFVHAWGYLCICLEEMLGISDIFTSLGQAVLCVASCEWAVASAPSTSLRHSRVEHWFKNYES